MHPCRVCHLEKPISPSRIKTCNWICSSCANQQRTHDNDACYLAIKLAGILRKRGIKAPFPSTNFARLVLQKCNGKSVLSGESNVKHLCIVQVDVDGGWTIENAVLVTSAESYALRRASHTCRQVLLESSVNHTLFKV